jgi:hypothetical protein
MSDWGLVRVRARLADTAVAASAGVLALLTLIPLFEDLQWLLPAVVMVLVVALLGAGSRAIAMPIPLIPIVEVLGVVATMTAMFVGQDAWARVIPTADAWNALGELIRNGMYDAQMLPAPVPTTPQLTLLVVGAAGLAALSIDTLFVSVRSPILAGIPIVTLYLGGTLLMFGRTQWWQFPPAAAAWLLLLAADQRDRVREWAGVDSTTRIVGLSSVARRTGLVAVAVALLAATILPVRGIAPWRTTGTGDEGGPAIAAPVVLDPLVTMRRDLILATDTEVLRYRTQNPTPPYLRVAALETFDGQTWSPRQGLTQSPGSGVVLPGNVMDQLTRSLPEYHVRGGSSYSYLFSVTSLENSYLPLPYPVMSVADLSTLRDDWRLDATTGIAYSDGKPATGLKYGVTALDMQTQPGELRDAAMPDGTLWPQLSVPSGMSPQVRTLARRVTQDARTPYDKALALQRWFTRDGGFRYSTAVRSGADADYLAQFLNERVGYCEQFAASMALMARLLGIPSRVMVGFTQGAQDADGSWIVTVRDAHAWPELWFDGVGWMRFEPTPRSDATVQAPGYAPDAAPSAATAGGDESRGRFEPEGFTPITPVDSGRGSWPAILTALTLLALAVAAATPMTRRLVRRRRRLYAGAYDAVVVGAWQEIGDTAHDVGQSWSPYSTPRQAADRLSRGMTEPATAALTRLRVQVEQVKYGPGGGGHVDAAAQGERSAAVRADVGVVRDELMNRVRRQVRLVARYWPPSVRRRQRSSSRSMKPGDLGAGGADGFSAVASSAGRALKAE